MADPSPAPFIAVDGVTLRFAAGGPAVLDDVSLEVGRGELVALIGPSGCGKSTVLNLVSGLLAPTSGAIRVADPAARMAYVFQRPRLLPWRTVRANVAFGLQQRNDVGGDIGERVARALALVNLEGHEDKYPHQLSGGMQQRVALARGLAIDPAVCLLDEPFGALDALTRGYLQEELLGIVRQGGMTTVLVTHDIDEALLLADRILVMATGGGRIRAEVRVPFGVKRSPDAVAAHPDYARLRRELREVLRPDVAEAA
jgi:ABC-type nitrate/sulfonate/bicarbonate transport system ATPase subunit